MYGMLLESVQYYIQQEYGKEIWEQVCQVTEISACVFVTHQLYNDALMPRIAQTCSEVIGGKTPDQYMEYFGECFVRFFSIYGHEKLLKLYCKEFRDFMAKIDNLHEHFRFVFPQLRSPSFRCEEETSDGLTLHYRSHRFGYEHYVIGQIKECARRYFKLDVNMKIVHKPSKDSMGDLRKCHIVFRVIFDNSYSMKDPVGHSHILTTTQTFPLSLFFEVFPFGFVLDKDLKIYQTGSGLKSYFQENLMYSNVSVFFKLRRPMARFSWKVSL